MNAPDFATEHFRKSLPADEAARWDDAIRQYDAVFRANVERWEGRAIPDAEWAEWKHSRSRWLHSYQPGHRSSALFKRLLEGKQALPLPPPMSFSYPWYSVIESPRSVNLMVAFEGERGSAMTLGEHARRRPQVEGAIGVVQINQSLWLLLERTGDEAIVTYGEWAGQGYRWRLAWVERDVDEVEPRILCHHEPSKAYIRTADELWREATFHVERQIEEERAVFEGRPLPSSEASGGSEAGDAKRVARPAKTPAMDEHMRSIIRTRLDQRIKRGYAPIPGKAAIRRRIKSFFDQYLQLRGDSRPMWKIDASGRLKSLQWELERLAPPIGP